MTIAANFTGILLHKPMKLRRLLPSKSFCLQILSAGTLATTGDLICQKLVEKKEKVDTKRTTRFALTTMLLIAPIQFHWFRFLEHRFKGGNPVRIGLKRLVVDQSILAPLLTGTFLFTVNFLDSFSKNSAMQRTKHMYLEVMANNYKFWPFVQAVNLTFVPLHLRVVFLQFFAIFWNIYISYKVNN